MQKRNLEELNLLDDFLMGSVLSYPGIGPEVCRRMVSIILNREIKQIRIIPQKVYFGADTDKHGIRPVSYTNLFLPPAGSPRRGSP